MKIETKHSVGDTVSVQRNGVAVTDVIVGLAVEVTPGGEELREVHKYQLQGNIFVEYSADALTPVEPAKKTKN